MTDKLQTYRETLSKEDQLMFDRFLQNPPEGPFCDRGFNGPRDPEDELITLFEMIKVIIEYKEQRKKGIAPR